MKLTDWRIFVILNMIFWIYLWYGHVSKQEARIEWGTELCQKISKDKDAPIELIVVCKNMKNGN